MNQIHPSNSNDINKTMTKDYSHMLSSSDDEFKWESKTRIIARILFGIIAGTVTALFLTWTFLFILIAGYCLVESMIVFIYVKRTEQVKVEVDELENTFILQRTSELSQDVHGYARSFAMVNFYLSFVMISVFGVFTKWISEFI